MNSKWPLRHLHGCSSRQKCKVLECIISRFYCISKITISKVLQHKGDIYSDYQWFITCSAGRCGDLIANTISLCDCFAFSAQTRSYLFHVSVVHGVVRHLIRLQLDNLFEFIAIAFPLADNDHLIKQEYVPKDAKIYSQTKVTTGIGLLCGLWIHLSCFVRLTMEHTFSSPSIFGLPYSSSLTCCLGHKDTENVNPVLPDV